MNSDTIQRLLTQPITGLQDAYRCGNVQPDHVIEHIIQRSVELKQHNIWIEAPSRELIDPYLDALSTKDIDATPLWGVPFAIKDNIDLAGAATTAACSAYTYQPEHSAHVVAQLIAAGAIPVGKTNLDQFATGLVGTRSPYGICTHPDRPEHISGGSSSGSAVAVSCGLASFALGTDTAGSGRIPAAFNGIVGYKPTRGLVSTSGVVPACRSLDCVSLLTRNVQDAATVAASMIDYDDQDAYARRNPFINSPANFGSWRGELTLGVLDADQLQFFGDTSYSDAYRSTLDKLRNAGIKTTPVAFEPFRQAASELYEGPWIAERYLAIQPLIEDRPDALLKITHQIISAGRTPSATDLLTSQYKLAELRRDATTQLDRCDALLIPTAGTHYQLSDVNAEPLVANTNLGYYTNFMNLLDLSGLALPGAETTAGLPFGISLVGDRLVDTMLLSIGQRLEEIIGSSATLPLEHTNLKTMDLVACGAHMSELPLNWQLTERGGQLIARTKTTPDYRLFALAGGPPYRPGMVRDPDRGEAIDVEVWRLPASTVASFLDNIPWPLAIGKVELEDGRTVSGFVCEPGGIEDAEEITHYGGWRAYMAERR